MAARSGQPVPKTLARRTLLGAAIAVPVAGSLQCGASEKPSDGTPPGAADRSQSGGAQSGRSTVSSNAEQGLASWFSALRMRQPGDLLHVAAVGHSIVFGMGSAGTNRETDADVGRGWVAQLRRLLNEPDGSDPGEGWMLSRSDTRIEQSGLRSSQRAPLARGTQLDASSRLTADLAGDEVWAMYWRGASPDATPRIMIDGELVMTSQQPYSDDEMIIAKATGLGPGTHQVVIMGPTKGSTHIAAIAPINPAGIAVHRLSESGHTMAQLVSGPSTSITDSSVLSSIQAATWKDAQLGIIECLTNDQTEQTPVADYLAATRSMIEGALTNGCQSMLLVADPASENPGSPIPESSYQEALQSLAQQYPRNVAYLSIAELWGAYAQADEEGLYQSGSVIHPSPKGHLSIAQHIHKMITAG